MKYIHFILLFSLSGLVTAIVGCTHKAKLDGVWRYEAPIAQEQLFGGGTVVTERIDLKLSPDGKVTLKWTQGESKVDFVEGSIQGDWKQEGDLLVMTNPDSSFGVFSTSLPNNEHVFDYKSCSEGRQNDALRQL